MKKQPKLFRKEFWQQQNFFKELSIIEHLVLWISIAITVGVFIYGVIYNYWKQSPYLTFVASVLNSFAVISCVKRKPISPILGLIASAILIPVNWIEKTYAMMIMQEISCITYIIAAITWTKNSDAKTSSIKPRPIKWWQTLIYFVIIAGLIVLYTWVEGLQSYQDFMAGPQAKKPVPIPALHLRIFESASLMITVGLILPNAFRLQNLLPLYLIGNIFQIAARLSQIIVNPSNVNAWMMLINMASFAMINIIGILNWYKIGKKKQLK